MADLKQCEFFLLRYVPDAVKGEFVNIGLILLGAPASDGDVSAQLRFTRDWARVKCVDPEADLEMLQALEFDLQKQLAATDGSRELILKKLDDSFSNTLQLSPTKACLTESPQAEIEILAQHYLETSKARKGRGDRATGARLRIFGQMRKSFEEAGVWELMTRKMDVSQYTGAGDSLKIDCGYRPNGVMRMFHAVSLGTNNDAAKILAYSFPQIREGMTQTLHVNAELTAIVENDLDRSDEEIRFGLTTLERNTISVASIAELGAIADLARRELRA